MARHYIPRPDVDAVDWMKAFAGGIAADAVTYAVPPDVVADLLARVAAFEAAFMRANSPETRTPSAVSGKTLGRQQAENLCRRVAQQIKMNPAISDPDKLVIGVPPLNRSRVKEVAVADESPWLMVVSATPGQHHMRYKEGDGSPGKAKPHGAMQLQVFVTISDAKGRDVNEARYCGSFTTCPFTIPHTHADDGKVATYWARWCGRRGDVGDWSNPVAMRIAA